MNWMMGREEIEEHENDAAEVLEAYRMLEEQEESDPEFVEDVAGSDSGDKSVPDAAMRDLRHVEELPEDLSDVGKTEEKHILLRDPGGRTVQECADHTVDHMFYPSWCPHSVRGRATGIQHKTLREAGGSSSCFRLVHGGATFELQSGDEGVFTTRIADCHASKSIFSNVVPQQGVDLDFCAVETLKRDIMWLGRTKLVLKTDNGRAILALICNTVKAPRTEDHFITSRWLIRLYDSASNVSTENASRQVGAKISTLRDSFSEHINMRIPIKYRVLHS